MRVDDDELALTEEVADYLACLEPQAKHRLAERMGVDLKGAARRAAPRLVQACLEPTVLLRATADLSDDALRLAGYTALRPSGRSLRFGRAAREYTPGPVHGEARAKAVEALVAEGLAVSHAGGLEVLPALAAAFASMLVAEAADRQAREAQAQAPLGFVVALAAVLIESEQPPLRQDGGIHASSLKRMQRRLRDGSLCGFKLEAAAGMVRRLGLGLQIELAGACNLGIDLVAARRVLSLPHADLAQAVLWDEEEPSPGLWTLARLDLALAQQDRSAPPGVEALEVALTSAPAPGVDARWWDGAPPDGWDTLQMLRVLGACGLVEVDVASPPPRYRRRAPAAPATAPWVVQPSFEVLVPWDAPPARVVALGFVAELEQIDRVCRFRLTPASVARGRARVGSGDELVALLEEGAAAPLPQNVRASVLSWAGREHPVRPVQGELLVASDAAQAAAVLRAQPAAREVAPLVLLLPEGTLAGTLERLRAADVPVGPVTTFRGAGSRQAGPDPCERAIERSRRYLEQTLRAATADEVRGRRHRAPPPSTDPRPPRQASPPQLPPTAAPPPPPTPAVPTWRSPLPGALRAEVEAAVGAGRELHLMYCNAAGRTVERRVRPVALRRGPQGEVLLAHDVERHADCTLVLDRVTAVAADR